MKCNRCDGSRFVKILLTDIDDYDHPMFGDRDCPRCGGSGVEPDAADLSEARYFHGPNWGE